MLAFAIPREIQPTCFLGSMAAQRVAAAADRGSLHDQGGRGNKSRRMQKNSRSEAQVKAFKGYFNFEAV
jgi:hypothetical protein